MKLKTLKTSLKSAGTRLATVAPGSWRESGASSTERGYGYRWQKARAAHLAEHPFCTYCLRDAGVTEVDPAQIILAVTAKGLKLPFATVVDHRIPHLGNQVLFWDRSNWQSLCASHHSRDKQREEAILRATSNL